MKDKGCPFDKLRAGDGFAVGLVGSFFQAVSKTARQQVSEKTGVMADWRGGSVASFCNTGSK